MVEDITQAIDGVNPTKFQTIIVGSKRIMSRLDIGSISPIIFNGSVIPFSPIVKDLGLLIDSTIDWQAQVTHVSQRLTGSLHTLYRLKNFLPPKTKITLMQPLIIHIIDYGDVYYLDLNADLLNKLDQLLDKCIRFVFNLHKYDHVFAWRCNSFQFVNVYVCELCLVYLLFSTSQLEYLVSHFHFFCSNHNRNLR